MQNVETLEDGWLSGKQESKRSRRVRVSSLSASSQSPEQSTGGENVGILETSPEIVRAEERRQEEDL